MRPVRRSPATFANMPKCFAGACAGASLHITGPIGTVRITPGETLMQGWKTMCWCREHGYFRFLLLKHHADYRDRIPRALCRVTSWLAYDASSRRHIDLTRCLDERAAIFSLSLWQTLPVFTRLGVP